MRLARVVLEGLFVTFLGALTLFELRKHLVVGLIAAIVVCLVGILIIRLVESSRKTPAPVDEPDTFRPVVVTSRDHASSAILGKSERPLLPPPVTLHLRAYAACHDGSLPVTLMKAKGFVVFDECQPVAVEAQLRPVADAFTIDIEAMGKPPVITSGPPAEIECKFHTRLPEELRDKGAHSIPDWARGIDMVFVDHLQREHPAGGIDFGPVLKGW
jgi:hypothetical protein